MLFISVRSSDSTQVSKVLSVVEETKRLRYKAGTFPQVRAGRGRSLILILRTEHR